MEMLLIIFAVIVVFLIHKQNTRIDNLEKLLKEKNLLGSAPSPVAQSQNVTPVVNPVQTVPLAVSTSTAKPLNNPTVSVPSSKPSTEESTGKFLGKLGIAAVLIGVAFFLKYAFDNDWIGPAGRVMIGVLFGLSFLGLGQWLRKKYLNYSDLLMGGGIAILYLSVFAANSFYHLIDPFMTGIFMCVVTILAFAISIVNATITLASIAVVGGFATPFLVGSNENNMVTLFGYVTVLNIGVLAVSFFKKWPKLVVLAFLGSGYTFTAWFARFYTEQALTPTLFFLLISFIIFIFASIARSLSAREKAGTLDYLLLGGNAFGFATMGYMILEPKHHGVLGFCAVLVSILYMSVAYTTNKYSAEDKALNIFLPGLAVVFLSLAVPLQLSGPWIAVAWIAESCFLYIIASFISNRGFQVMGIIVYILGILNFLSWGIIYSRIKNFIPFFNQSFAVLTLAVVAGYFIAYMYHRYGSINVETQKRGIAVFVVVANILTIYAFSTQIIYYHSQKQINLSEAYSVSTRNADLYNTGYDNSIKNQQAGESYYKEVRSISNQSNTMVSIFWALYAIVLTGIGFAKRIAGVRRLGLVLFVATAIKVLMSVWSLGELYRIISFVVFGLIALLASFAYAKYKDRL